MAEAIAGHPSEALAPDPVLGTSVSSALAALYACDVFRRRVDLQQKRGGRWVTQEELSGLVQAELLAAARAIVDEVKAEREQTAGVSADQLGPGLAIVRQSPEAPRQR